MDQGFKAKWCEALRSDEFPQGMWSLRDDQGRYCCLGVGTEILRRENPSIGHWEPWPGNTQRDEFVQPGGGEGFYMPYNLLEEIGLQQSQAYRLAQMNDSGASFAMIADVIEQEM